MRAEQSTFDSRFEQHRHLSRVRGSIGQSVLRFLRTVGAGNTFLNEQLRAFVCAETKCAPDSPRRVLADLCADNAAQVECVNRTRSLYRVVRVGERAA